VNARAGWRAVPERGTVIGIKFVAALCRLVGRRAAVAFVHVLSIYYALFDWRSRRASKAYLRRVGQPDTFGSVVKHFSYFARVALDRYLFLAGRLGSFDIRVPGRQTFERIQGTTTGRGTLLLGSHVGSFEAMRALATSDGVRLAVLVDFRNAQRINRVLEELSPNKGFKVIGLDPSRATSMLDVKACIDRGDVVALLVDRLAEGEARMADVDFLGAKAALPTGPFLLAHMLGCPVYTFAALFSPPNRYEIHCDPFADRVTLPRATRAEAAQAYAQDYAAQLERYVAMAPYNWFNFFDFWRS
jgi:predicted LPLAT superfamily acyltransferase